MSGAEPWNAARAAEIIAALAGLPGAALPILHALQHAFGHVPDAAVPMVASALNLSRAEVHGVLTFYPDFRRTPAGRHIVKLCRAEACQAVGADRLHGDILRHLGITWHQTAPDGFLTAEPVFCLGLCACGPAALLDGQPLARLTVEKLVQALAEADA